MKTFTLILAVLMLVPAIPFASSLCESEYSCMTGKKDKNHQHTFEIMITSVAAVLMDTIGMPWLFIGQGLFSICAALIENTIQLTEETRVCEKTFSFQVWKEDLQEVLRYFKKERGLQAIYYYMAATNGVASGYAHILVAFFRTALGMSAALYCLCS